MTLHALKHHSTHALTSLRAPRAKFRNLFVKSVKYEMD